MGSIKVAFALRERQMCAYYKIIDECIYVALYSGYTVF